MTVSHERAKRTHFDEHRLEEGIGRRSIRGGAALMISRAVTAVIQVGSILMLARMLSPEDYGLVAMVTAFTGFAPVLVDLGTRDAVTQRTRISRGELSALFWLTFGIGAAMAVAVAAAGPVIAAFYDEPRLTTIARVLALSFVALGLTAQHQALLRRAFMFWQMAVLDITANVVSATVAIVMAYQGYGYWALVVRPVVMYACAAVGTWWFCWWLPGKPALGAGVGKMVRFGMNLTGFSLTDFVRRNADRVVVGRALGPAALGYYQNCFLIYENLLEILVFCLHQVAVTGLSKLQHELGELRRAWAKALSTVAFYAMPAFGILAIIATDLIVLLLGERWETSGTLLGVLALGGIPHSAEMTLGWLHVVAARTDRWLRWGVAATCVRLIALACGLPFGVLGIVCANVASAYVLAVPALVYAGRPLGIGVGDVLRAIRAQVVGALVAAGVGFALRPLLLFGMTPLERMGVLIGVYVAVYLVVVIGLFRLTAPIDVARSLLGGRTAFVKG